MNTQHQDSASGSPPLADIMSPEDYTRTRGHVFPSLESWRWWYRRNREELFRRGALIEIGGRLRIIAAAHDRAVLEIPAVPRKTSRWGNHD